jgi:hypothetical protein
MIRYSLRFLAAIAIISTAKVALASEARVCVTATLGVDLEQTTATLEVPSLQRRLPSKSFWRATGVTNSGIQRYSLRIDATLIPEGRQYPVVIRLGKNVIAISLRDFLEKSSEYSKVLCDSVAFGVGETSTTISLTRLGGYVFLKNGQPFLPLSMIADDRVPIKFTDGYLDWQGKAQTYYERLLGHVRKETVSILFLLDQGTDQPGCRYEGSALPGLLLIGLRRGCLDPSQDSPPGLTHFVAHEVFHQWNYGLAVGGIDSTQQAFRLMQLEGGAELAAHMVESASDSGLEQFVGNAAEACLASIGSGELSITARISSGGTDLAYSCGVVYVFLSAISKGRDIEDGFRNLWLQLINGGSDSSPEKRGELEEEFSALGSPKETLIRLFQRARYQLAEAQHLNADQRFGVAMELVRSMQHSDCNGSHGFFTGGGKIILDIRLESCRSFLPGHAPMTIAGFDIYASPLLASMAWQKACERTDTVTVEYAEPGVTPSLVRCLSKYQPRFNPLQLTRLER